HQLEYASTKELDFANPGCSQLPGADRISLEPGQQCKRSRVIPASHLDFCPIKEANGGKRLAGEPLFGSCDLIERIGILAGVAVAINHIHIGAAEEVAVWVGDNKVGVAPGGLVIAARFLEGGRDVIIALFAFLL